MLKVWNYKRLLQPSHTLMLDLFCILLEAQNKKLQCAQELFHGTQIYSRKNDNIFTCVILYNAKFINRFEKSLF